MNAGYAYLRDECRLYLRPFYSVLLLNKKCVNSLTRRWNRDRLTVTRVRVRLNASRKLTITASKERALLMTRDKRWTLIRVSLFRVGFVCSPGRLYRLRSRRRDENLSVLKLSLWLNKRQQRQRKIEPIDTNYRGKSCTSTVFANVELIQIIIRYRLKRFGYQFCGRSEEWCDFRVRRVKSDRQSSI